MNSPLTARVVLRHENWRMIVAGIVPEGQG
jgi:hypothetical protein